MAFTAQELTKLINETDRAKKAVDYMLDFIDLIKGKQEGLSFDTEAARDKIRTHAEEIDIYVAEIRAGINKDLDKIPVDEDEVRNGADKTLLYQNDLPHAMDFVKSQQRRYTENSYYWRYWEEVNKNLAARAKK